MRRVFALLTFVLVSSSSLAVAQAQPDLGAYMGRFAAAQTSGNAQEAAQIAAEVAALDLSTTPLQPREVRDLRAALADALAAGGRLDDALALLAQIITEDRADLAQASDAAAISELRAALLARLERLGDLQAQAGSYQAAAATYARALEEARATLGREDPQTRFILAKLLDARRRFPRAVSADDEINATRLQQLQAAAQAEPLISLGGEAADRPFETIRVFFGASRNATEAQNPERTFGNARSGLSFGSVLVTVPKNRALGAIPRPGWFDFEGAQDGVHIVLRRVDRDASAEAFRDRLSRSIADPVRQQRDAFVYIHGYNENFANAVRRTAQLAVDLDMRNGAVLYSWPSGDMLSYQVAQNNVEPSVDALVSLLRTVTSSGAERVHLFAHSMGNRVLLGALDTLRQSGFAAQRPAFGQIIFASPDIDADVFVDRVNNVRRLAQGMTLYASNNDRALQLSRWLGGGYARAGEVPIASSIARSVVAVDTSLIRRSPGDLFAHSDYVGGAINDLRAVVWLSLAPRSRCLLASRGNHWEASDARRDCEDEAFRRAISAVRLYGPDAPSQIEAFIRQLEVSGDRADLASWRSALRIVRQLQR